MNRVGCARTSVRRGGQGACAKASARSSCNSPGSRRLEALVLGTRRTTTTSWVPRAAPQSSSPVSSASAEASTESKPQTPEQVVRAFYDAWNRADVDAVLDCFADDVVYHDAIYYEPYFGKASLTRYFELFRTIEGLEDLKFTVTDCVSDDKSCGVVWHTQLGDDFFPFSRGCSFYKVNAEGKIVWGRDVVEAAPPKPGDGALTGLQGLIPLIRRIGPKNADPANLTLLPFASAAMWAFYAAYVWWITLGTAAPGDPAWQLSPETVAEITHESVNIFYINVALDALGLAAVPSVAEHPVSEALFNFITVWGTMFLPVMLMDKHAHKVKFLTAQWVGIVLVTNVFFIPYLAQRATPDPHYSGLAPPQRTDASLSPQRASAYTSQILKANAWKAEHRGDAEQRGEMPRGSRFLGALGLFIGGLSLAWALFARPEYGDLASRAAYFGESFNSVRVFYAFVFDTLMYSVWQAWLLGDAGAAMKYRAVPLFGLAFWLLEGCPREAGEAK